MMHGPLDVLFMFEIKLTFKCRSVLQQTSNFSSSFSEEQRHDFSCE